MERVGRDKTEGTGQIWGHMLTMNVTVKNKEREGKYVWAARAGQQEAENGEMLGGGGHVGAREWNSEVDRLLSGGQPHLSTFTSLQSTTESGEACGRRRRFEPCILFLQIEFAFVWSFNHFIVCFKPTEFGPLPKCTLGEIKLTWNDSEND